MKQKFIQMMQGRYGTDKLNQHLLYLGVVVAIVGIFTRQVWLQGVWLLLLVYVYYRTFSRRIQKRYQENQAYLTFLSKVNAKWDRIKSWPKYKYFTCETCKTRLRVPRRKGNIEITCPNCKTKFDAKS
ncbi:hypothetical protein PT169_01040 [Erysipelothrix rhusiopathiae]|uniref:hypothetical protein n=1 Tax=Erysipelothrix rhusiopathiae TaxID=1648 RepID=UPI000F432D17|nr:hypothetical protein [Erysipelothrix rhusiopathiae]AYV34167.1 hypothetical protein EEY85_02165 [Erysipelothrix rhusiopathiae]MDE8070385.1 hypothetical protein [Erysipelothrix rhusiopathiae]MDE8253018.1 hypothetical protein [Erysipelothrix rhusiopathiae]MDE8313721.1 hypothetical protein [Erysipelothrix rhusiopathiae]MDE8328994.1 hypothetical protein [Erysipelothrix rhusiopathiae]